MSETPGAEAPILGGGADSSNRPWETESLRVGPDRTVSRLGLLAACAAALMSLADMALLYSPGGGYGFGTYDHLADVPRERLLLGHYLGILVVPAYIAGYWLVLCGLRDAGAWRSWPVFLLGSYAAAVGGALHGMFALLALIVHHQDVDPASSRQLLDQAGAFVEPLHGLLIARFVGVSAWFAVAVASGLSRFPRWLAAANPLVLAVLFVLPHYLLPQSTPALLAAPASFNLAHLAFFLLVWATLGSAQRRRSQPAATRTARGAPAGP